MALEFLQTDGDIVEFLSFLYERNFRISYRLPRKAHIELDQSAAVRVLLHDLHTIWSCYYIGDENRREILMLDSCGPQAHPRNLGWPGRSAGRIGHIDKNDPTEKELMRLIRNYFRRNYPEYLHTGRMIKSPKMTVKEILMPRSGNGVCRVPAVHSSSWKAEDGSIAHILTNWQDGEETVTLELDTGYTLIYSDGTKKVLSAGKVTLAIPRFTAVMTEKKYEKN